MGKQGGVMTAPLPIHALRSGGMVQEIQRGNRPVCCDHVDRQAVTVIKNACLIPELGGER